MDIQPCWCVLELTQPAMLWWALGAVIPWLLWWSRPRGWVTEAWGAMRFIQPDAATAVRHQQRWQWIQLALRTAVLLLIPLALAQPRWIGGPAGAVAETSRPTHWIFVLDASASMRTRSATGDRWAEAQQAVSRRIDALSPNSVASILAVGPRCVSLATPGTSDRSRLRAALTAAQPTFGAADWSAMFPVLESLIETHAAQFDQQRVVVISDLQSSTWRDWVEPPAVERLRESLGERLQWDLIAVGGGERPQWTLTDLRVVHPVAMVGRPVRCLAEVRNWGDQPQSIELQLRYQGELVARRMMDVPARSSPQVALEFTPRRAGRGILEAELAADSLVVDNMVSAPMLVHQRLPIMLVRDELGSTEPLPLAFDTPRDAPYQFQLEVVRPSRLTSFGWRDAPLVVTDDVAHWSTAELEALGQYVTQGGSLLMILGPRIDQDQLNQWRHQEAGMLPGVLMGMAERGSYRLAAGVDTPSWLAAPFAEHPEAGLQRVPIWRYWRVGTADDAENGPATWLNFAHGDPAVMANAVGRGVVVVVTTSPALANDYATLPWSALGIWPGLVPLAHEIALLAAGDRQHPAVVESGSPWSNLADAAADRDAQEAGATRLVQLGGSPAVAERPATWQRLGGTPEGSLSRDYADQLGSHTPISLADSWQPRDVATVRVPAAESDPRRVDQNSLRDVERGDIGNDHGIDHGIDDALSSGTPREIPLAWLAILIALVGLLVDSYWGRSAWTRPA